jgi:hypothetical protein
MPSSPEMVLVTVPYDSALHEAFLHKSIIHSIKQYVGDPDFILPYGISKYEVAEHFLYTVEIDEACEKCPPRELSFNVIVAKEGGKMSKIFVNERLSDGTSVKVQTFEHSEGLAEISDL